MRIRRRITRWLWPAHQPQLVPSVGRGRVPVAMRLALTVVALLAIFALPLAVPAQDADVPVPLCFEQTGEGAVRVRSRDGGWFQVIPPGGLDDQQEFFLEAVVRPGATVKLAGGAVSAIYRNPRGGARRRLGQERGLGTLHWRVQPGQTISLRL